MQRNTFRLKSSAVLVEVCRINWGGGGGLSHGQMSVKIQMCTIVLHYDVCFYLRVFKAFSLLNEKDVCHLQVRIFLRNGTFLIMLLCMIIGNLEFFQVA